MSDDQYPAIGHNGGPLIEPLVPPEVDLRGLHFMPLYGDLLIKSKGWILASGDAAKAMLQLWWHAFAHEVPAASLPNDDRLLAAYAGFGEVPGLSVKAWQKVKAEALWKWQLARDGRLYHPILADIAMKSWSGRTTSSAVPKSANATRQAQHRAKVASRRRDLEALGVDAPKGATLAQLDEMLRTALNNDSADVTHNATETQGNADVTLADDVTRNAHAVTSSVTRNAPVTSQGTGTDQGTGITTENKAAAQLITGGCDGDALRCAQDELVYEVARAAVVAAGLDDAHVETEFPVVQGWLTSGLAKATILLVIRAKVQQARKTKTTIGSLAYFTPALRDSQVVPAQHAVTPAVTTDPAAVAERWRERLRKCIGADGRWDEFRWDGEVYGHAPPHQGYRVPIQILGEAEFRGHFPALFPTAPAEAAA